MENKTEIRRALLLSIQRALLGMIYPSIRGIAVGFDDLRKLTVIYYLDREPNEDDYESINQVIGEVLGDVIFESVSEKCIFSSENWSKLDKLDAWVYARKED